jgi:guanine deaminase
MMSVPSQPDSSLMCLCISMASDNVSKGRGGPFAALVVKDGEIIGRGVNRVTSLSDPTAHAEVEAIRDACHQTGDYRLEGAFLYSSCEPCPMCLGAIYWAGISGVFYAASREEAEESGFRDALIYQEINKLPDTRIIPFTRVLPDGYTLPFEIWRNSDMKTLY